MGLLDRPPFFYINKPVLGHSNEFPLLMIFFHNKQKTQRPQLHPDCGGGHGQKWYQNWNRRSTTVATMSSDLTGHTGKAEFSEVQCVMEEATQKWPVKSTACASNKNKIFHRKAFCAALRLLSHLFNLYDFSAMRWKWIFENIFSKCSHLKTINYRRMKQTVSGHKYPRFSYAERISQKYQAIFELLKFEVLAL